MDILETYVAQIHNHPGGPFNFNVDGVYNVPVGTLTINEWSVGTQFRPRSSVRTILFWDQDGSGKNLVKIDMVYTAKATYKRKLPDGTATFVSDGKSRVIVHRCVFGPNAPREVYVRWAGSLN
jgi:hypothetical protein